MNEQIKEYFKPGRKNIIFAYLMFLGGLIMPTLTLIGAIFAYMNMDNSDKILSSHYTFAFRTFCVVLIGRFVAMVTTFILIGPIISFIIFIWAIVRSILALQCLLEGERHPNSLTFWIK